ncbi:MAG: hypothetical protein WCW52_08200 [Elusimicrobiales bacterium]|jgi:hypothetical protein
MKFAYITALILIGSALPAGAAADNNNMQGRILGIPGDRVGVDMDAFHELQPGEIGILKRNGTRVASVEVVSFSQTEVSLRVLDSVKGFTPRADDIVYFTPQKPAARAGAGAGLGGEDLVPLLTPLPAAGPSKKPAAPYKKAARTHGRALLRQFYQEVRPINFNQRVSRIDSDGAVENLGGGPWSFVWSGNGNYLEGNHPSLSDNFRRFRLRARRLTLSRPLGEAGFFRAGRFFPKELPGLGTVDGLAVEAPAGWFRLGAVAGARPDRRFQDFSSHELLGAVYAASETGSPGQGSYAATLGLMHTRWLGRSDELAALFDQNFDLGPLLSAYQTAQLDFNDGAAKFHKGARLTRLDLSLNSNLSGWLVLRGGFNHYEPVDAAADRAIAGEDSATAINNGYWRYWTGSGQTLPWNLGLDEEISWTRAEGRMQPGLWRATLWRQGLPGMPDLRAYFTGYNITGPAGADYGGSSGVTLPMSDGKFLVDANAGFHYDRRTSPASGRILKLSDAGLRLDWRPGRVWQLDASASRTWNGSLTSSSLSAGLALRW